MNNKTVLQVIKRAVPDLERMEIRDNGDSEFFFKDDPRPNGIHAFKPKSKTWRAFELAIKRLTNGTYHLTGD